MKADELRDALSEIAPWVGGSEEIARTICDKLGITREMANTLRPPRSHHGGKAEARRGASDIFTALLDLANEETDDGN